GDEQRSLGKLEQALANMRLPLQEQMRRHGLRRAALFARSSWREQFGRIVEQLLDDGPRTWRFDVRVQPHTAGVRAAARPRRVLWPARVSNHGTPAVLPDGPGRTILRCRVACSDGSSMEEETTLAGLLAPDQTQSLAIPVPVPADEGEYA